MALQQIQEVTGTAVHVPGADIDTDRIIPARFMKCVTFDGLGEFAFYDVRFDPNSGERTDHPLNDERFNGAGVLIAGVNFGCGSSREHAPQAIYRSGFRAIIAESFAEIFFGNSTTLGMPCVSASREDIESLGAAIEEDPGTGIRIDLEGMTVSYGDRNFAITMPDSARQALTAGRWDPIQELLDNEKEITSVGDGLAYV